MKRLWLLLFLVGVTASAAPEPPPEQSVPQRREPVVIDGNPDDPTWRNAAVIMLDRNAFGESAELRATELRLLWDKEFLYALFRCADPDPVSVGEKHDDPLHNGDAVEIFIDGTGDGRQFFELQFNAAGLVRDVNYLFTGESLALDADGLFTDWANVWDDPGYRVAGLRIAATRTADGYVIECAIPAGELLRRRNRRELRPGDRLRANFVRLDRRSDGATAAGFWSPTVSGRPHRSPGRMGYLDLESETLTNQGEKQ